MKLRSTVNTGGHNFEFEFEGNSADLEDLEKNVDILKKCLTKLDKN